MTWAYYLLFMLFRVKYYFVRKYWDCTNLWCDPPVWGTNLGGLQVFEKTRLRGRRTKRALLPAMVVTLCAAIGRGAPCPPIGRSPTAQWRQSSNAVRSVIAVVAAAAYCTHATFVSQMASNNGDELDTDLAAAPAKRMRYSFADEIVNGSQFEGFGQRFTGFPSGDCYGKSNRMPPRLDSPRTARKHGGHVPVCVPPGVLPPTPRHSERDVIDLLSFPRSVLPLLLFHVHGPLHTYHSTANL